VTALVLSAIFGADVLTVSVALPVTIRASSALTAAVPFTESTATSAGRQALRSEPRLPGRRAGTCCPTPGRLGGLAGADPVRSCRRAGLHRAVGTQRTTGIGRDDPRMPDVPVRRAAPRPDSGPGLQVCCRAAPWSPGPRRRLTEQHSRQIPKEDRAVARPGLPSAFRRRAQTLQAASPTDSRAISSLSAAGILSSQPGSASHRRKRRAEAADCGERWRRQDRPQSRGRPQSMRQPRRSLSERPKPCEPPGAKSGSGGSSRTQNGQTPCRILDRRLRRTGCGRHRSHDVGRVARPFGTSRGHCACARGRNDPALPRSCGQTQDRAVRAFNVHLQLRRHTRVRCSAAPKSEGSTTPRLTLKNPRC